MQERLVALPSPQLFRQGLRCRHYPKPKIASRGRMCPGTTHLHSIILRFWLEPFPAFVWLPLHPLSCHGTLCLPSAGPFRFGGRRRETDPSLPAAGCEGKRRKSPTKQLTKDGPFGTRILRNEQVLMEEGVQSYFGWLKTPTWRCCLMKRCPMFACVSVQFRQQSSLPRTVPCFSTAAAQVLAPTALN